VITVGYYQNQPIPGVINLIARNTPLPASKTEKFTTVNDNQTHVYCGIAQNMEDLPTQNGENTHIPLDTCQILWEGMLEILPGLPRGSLTTDTYQIDENGLLTLITEDPASGNRLVQKIETGHTEINESSQTTKRCRELTVE
jgi:molecular chaperone DnaK (HSP70)